MELSEFILEHENDDLAALVLRRDRWPDVDVALAAECIASRRKLRLKVPQWYADPALICPVALSAEQCSSTATASYKAAVAADGWTVRELSEGQCPDLRPLAGQGRALCPSRSALCGERPMRIADLTGGLGVDCWQFSKVAGTVLYNEMNPVLFEAAKINLPRLECNNVEFSNIRISPETLPELLDSFQPDLVFADPARRAQGGKKVFLPEDCSPDMLALQDIILDRGIRLMLKLSPMADISLLLRKFHCVKELHIVQSDGECKELLLLQEPGFDGECTVSAVVAEPSNNSSIKVHHLDFHPAEEKASPATYISSPPSPGQYLFEPGPALSKAGAFKLLSSRFGLLKLGPSAHLYIGDFSGKIRENVASGAEGLQPEGVFGEWFEILDVAPFGKASIHDFATRWPCSAVSARALPLSSDELSAKLTSLRKKPASGQIHIFGIGTSAGRLLIACRPLKHLF